MKNFRKVPITIDTRMSVERLTEEFDKRIEQQKYFQFHKLKGSPVTIFRRTDDMVKITKYKSYKKDFAGPVFTGQIRKGLDYATLNGNLEKTAGYKVLAGIILGSYIIDLIAASYFLIFTPGVTFIDQLPILMCTLAIRIFIVMMLFRFEEDEIKEFNALLQEICTADDVKTLYRPDNPDKLSRTDEIFTDEDEDDERD